MPNIRCYLELQQLETFKDRYSYLRLRSAVGATTFGFDRYINQQFYRSREWRSIRHHVIVRDNGCDLGIEGYEIHDRIIIHHMNPMIIDDLVHGNSDVLDSEFLISVSHETHNAIHYGDDSLLKRPLVARRPGDTKLW